MENTNWEIVCGKGVKNFTVWSDGDFGPCFENLIFTLIPHAILAICSAYHFGRHQHRRLRGRIERSLTLHFRLCCAVVLLTSPLVVLMLLFLYEKLQPGLLTTFSYIMQFISWFVHSGFIWRLHRLHHIPLRGPVSIVFSILFNVGMAAVRLRTAIRHRIFDTKCLTLSEEILIYLTNAVHLLYLLTLLPKRRPPISSSLLDIQSSDADHIAASDVISSARSEDGAGCFSRLFFLWIHPLMSKGADGMLNSADDIFQLPKRLQTANIETKFKKFMVVRETVPDLQTTNSISDSLTHPVSISDSSETSHPHDFENNFPHSSQQPPPTKLLVALRRAFGCEYFLLGILKFISDAFMFSGPVLLNLLISYMEDSSEPSWHGYIYTLALFLTTFLGSICSTQFNYQMLIVGLKFRAAIISTVYRKTLCVSSVVMSAFSSGEVVNFMSTDTDRIVDFCPSFHQFWSLPVQVSVALYLLYQQVGIAFLAGVGFAVLLVPINRWLALKIGQLSQTMMSQKDARVRMMNEMMYGIRIIKFYAWEPQFTQRINVLREAELVSLRGRKYLDAMCVFFWATTPVLISILTFTTYVLMGNTLTAAKVFTSIALFGILITPLNAFPWVINGLMEAWVSLKRIQKFMDLDELNWNDYYDRLPVEYSGPEVSICVRDGQFAWNVGSDDTRTHQTIEENGSVTDDSSRLLLNSSEDNDIHRNEIISNNSERGNLRLQEINLDIPKGSLVGVIGKVGCGKSSLFSALLSEMSKVSGEVFVENLSDGFGYVSQEAWIQHATVQENILFGRSLDLEKYNRVIEACALSQDLVILPAGDQTEIGENGVTLSGGQKARVALARSVYQDKPIYLLDDPLAAVDAHVAQHLFDHCIMGILEGTTRVLATHHTRFLQKADLVVVMENGKIVKCAPPSQLLFELHIQESSNAAKHSSNPETEPSKLKHDTNEGIANTEEGAAGTLVQAEEKDSGVVKSQVYLSYWKAIGHCLGFSVLLSLLLMQASRNVSDWWLSYWVTHAHQHSSSGNQSLELHKLNFLLASLSNELYRTSVIMTTSMYSNLIPSTSTVTNVSMTNISDSSDNISFYMIVYGSLAGFNSLATLFRAFLFAYSGIEAAKLIHKRLLSSILKAPIGFFDVTPIGRIINRFSTDVYSIDDSLPFVVNILLAQTFGVLGTIVICCYGLPYAAILITLLSVVYFFIQKYYRHTSRELKRISSVTLSPIYAHFSETVAGLATIRALRQTKRFKQENQCRLECNQRAQFASKAVSQWLNIWFQMIGVALVTGVAVIAILEHNYGSVNPGLVGLAISYILSVTNLLSGLVMSFTETEKLMVSVERASQYIDDVPHEDQASVQILPQAWPSEGIVSFRNVNLQYRPGLPNALDGITFETRPAEKIGIVGRTGSGKSSLFLALFRMVEIQSGDICIDGINVHQLPLSEFRSRLAIIPQDPFLFSGSIRENLDPTHQHDNNRLVDMLARCHLADVVERLGGLDAEVAERGRHFSVGQRQLMCLARALLTEARVLCIDEATASVDLQTDDLLQQTIREQFYDRTVLTIAHRTATVVHSDRVMVLSYGKVVEFAPPSQLLDDDKSLFYGFVNSSS